MPLPEFAKRGLFRLLRTSFRLVPMPVSMRDHLRQRFLERHAHLIPEGPRGRSNSVQVMERRPRGHSGGQAIGHVGYKPGKLPERLPATLVAFYLPQFHPIPENDAWWGAGFTEWRNVTRALPQFEGHAQPRLPGELGYYDLRQPDAMRQQIELAREYGIGAFCSYFYWFAGKRLLEQPLLQWLADSSLDFPLCLCWANENWSRRWDGRGDQILIGQQHSVEDDLAFIAYISRYLADSRYLRVEGKPMLLVYRPGLLPEPKATAQRWRAWCRENGVGEIHLAYVQSFDRIDPRSIGFDAAVEFPPNNTTLPPITEHQRLINPDFRGDVHDWRELARTAVAQPDPNYLLYPGVNPGWDNEPRRSGRGRTYAHASPRGYRDWLRHAIDTACRRQASMPMVFINAWNEWAEGAVLEPDIRLGYAWLEATRSALLTEREPSARPCVIVHAWYVDVLDDIVAALRASGIAWRTIITTAPEQEEAVRACLTRLDMDAEIAVFENRGRDVLPFLHVANRLLDEGTQIILKLHTKRSTHRQDGDQWRRELIDKLLSAERAPLILDAFLRRASLGLVAAEGHMQPLDYYWGANEANVDYLCRRLGIKSASPAQGRFIAGTMFWARLDALRPLLDANLGLWEFEDETGQIDGSMAHAVERMILLTAAHVGFVAEDAAQACGLPSTRDPKTYPYASRDA